MSISPLFVAGNWKMNGRRADLQEIATVKAALPKPHVDVAIFPPATLLSAAAGIADGSPLAIGAQDCHTGEAGAFTGDISAPMLADSGARAVIVGHSERRLGHGEVSALVRAKAASALKAKLTVVVCLGDTAGERAVGLQSHVCLRQLKESLPADSSPANTLIAYEPVWAIGTGVNATVADIAGMHRLLRGALDSRTSGGGAGRWRILYGGSVTPTNAAAIFSCEEVDGVLVGGASLKSASFLAIIAAAAEAADARLK